jgi:cytidyltransferase-like protein
MDLVDGRVMIFGTFDTFHPGHEYFLNASRDSGEELIVVIARDNNVRRFKAVLRNGERDRKEIVQNHFQDVKVVLGDCTNPLKVVRKYKPALICLGYDQVGYSEALRDKFPEIKIKRLKSFYPEKYKSSKMN